MIPKLFNLAGKVALITGSARGLGRGYAQGLAGAGAVAVCMSRTVPDETVSLIREAGGKAEAVRADVTHTAEVENAINAVVKKYGRLDILVNNAGTEIPKKFLEYTEKEYEAIMDTNLKGVFFACQAAAHHMVRQRSGKIINVGSLGSQIGLAGAAVYCASKGGVLQFTRALAVEIAPYNVQVNAIGPGYFRTDMTEPFFQDPGHKNWIENRIPMGRIGKPEDLVGTVVFLSSSSSDYITGQIIYVDGGWLAS
ncbi:2-deoxy-D-gluconate 3-dehydrogenase [Desulfotomaculum arcticum]|uniref:2-deoxy-D-gluconate 3-dehydrogenase n=1 Tax=Desulfotruncus arcticus DSM 17038 TaxID=1121424 RepID=A0A1I2ZR84_9FIRM|nr:glucose 1-dehydrogenase [Desulfotruncus arcticus]SFH40106.1 2-deoxy-D-gluconate 3-dehydrogenase [Desulfotomaculum arcticum] [Desulfotruncus arcticus DSM 17038]